MANDTIICEISINGQFILKPLQPIQGGTPPYTYNWIVQDSKSGSLQLAHNFLSDPDKLETKLISSKRNNTYILSVRDSGGITCSNSIDVHFPLIKRRLISRKSIKLGESVELETSITGGYEPFSYKWSPDSFLDNRFLKNPVASPIKETIYILEFRDSMNCDVYVDTCIVDFRTTGISRGPKLASDSIFSVYFDSESSKLVVQKLSSGKFKSRIEIRNYKGQKVHSESLFLAEQKYQFQI